MIDIFIFLLHAVVAVWVFMKRRQEEGTKEGFLAVGFMALMFTVFWTISSFLLQFVVPPEGLGLLLDRDTLSLVLLTIFEVVFYYVFFGIGRRALQRREALEK